MVQHQLAQAQTAKLWADVHAFDFTVFSAEELDAATTGRHPIMPHYKKSDGFTQELLDTKPVTAFFRIQPGKVCF